MMMLEALAVILMFADFEYFMQTFSLGYRDCGILEWNPVPFPIPSRTKIPSRYRFLRDTGLGLFTFFGKAKHKICLSKVMCFQ